MLIAITIALFVLQLLDHYTTRTIINNGGRELNPIMAKAFEIFGMDEALAIKTIAVTALGYWICSVGYWAATAGLCVFYVFILIHNWRSMPK